MIHANQPHATAWNGIESLEERLVFSAEAASAAPLIAPAASTAPALITANMAYVQKIYNDMLNRAGSDAEVAAWANLLNQGTTKQSIVDKFRNSIEYISLEVDAAYHSFFNRGADPVGKAFWSHYVSKDLPIGQLYIRLLNSDEYFRLHPDINSYVTGLYHDILGRAASSTEITGWANSGNNYTTLASNFVYSNERYQNTIAGYYSVLFNRQPDYNSYVAFVQYAQTQDREVTNLLTPFLISAEYINLPPAGTNLNLAGVGLFQNGVPFTVGQPIAV